MFEMKHGSVDPDGGDALKMLKSAYVSYRCSLSCLVEAAAIARLKSIEIKPESLGGESIKERIMTLHDSCTVASMSLFFVYRGREEDAQAALWESIYKEHHSTYNSRQQ